MTHNSPHARIGNPLMKPRAIVWDLFGDHLRYIHDGRVRMRALNQLLDLFGVGESTTRVVLSRMRREGWFTTSREGRQTSYALTRRSVRMLDEGQARIFDRGRDAWDGIWRTVIYAVPEESRGERDRVRRTLAWHGFGPLAAGTWISPHPRLETVRDALAGLSATRMDLLESRALSRAADREMAFRCWDLDGLGRDYVELISGYEQLPGALELAALPGSEALRRQVELVASYRALPFRDPDLPAALLPEGWPGRRAHELFTAAHDALQENAVDLKSKVKAPFVGLDLRKLAVDATHLKFIRKMKLAHGIYAESLDRVDAWLSQGQSFRTSSPFRSRRISSRYRSIRKHSKFACRVS